MDDVQSAVLFIGPPPSLVGSGPSGAPLQPYFGNIDFKAYSIDFENRAVNFGYSHFTYILVANISHSSFFPVKANYDISQALVTAISYTNASFYGCSFASYQDTWYTGRNASTYVVDSNIYGQTDCEKLPTFERPVYC